MLPRPSPGCSAVNLAERLQVDHVGGGLRIRSDDVPDRLFASGTGHSPLLGWERGGHRIAIERDGRGLAVALHASWGRSLVVERHGHRIASLAPARRTPAGLLPDGAPHVRYLYGPDGDLVGALDRLEHGERYDYRGHLLARRSLATGFSFRFEWDGDGPGARCVRNWGDEGIYDYRFEWDGAQGRSRAIDSRGGVTDYVHDASGRLRHVTSAGHVTQTMHYDGRGLLVQVDRAGKRIAAYEHDDVGRLVSSTDARGAVRTMTYDADGRLASVTDPLGHATRWQYDAASRLVRLVDAAGGVTSFGYDARGLLSRVTDPVGRVRLLWWDEAARNVAEIGFDGVRRHFSHDADGRIVAVSAQERRVRRYEWDAVGRLVAATNEDGERVTLRYNASGRLTHRTDAAGATTEYRYDQGLAQPSQRLDPLGRVLQYHYDSERHLVALTDAAGQRCTLEWDLDGRLVGETGFDGRTRRYEVDAAGRLAGVAEAAADGTWKTTRMERDSSGRLVAKHFPDGTTHRFRHDTAGRLVAASTPEHQVEFAYDALGRVVSESQQDRVVTHRRDALGRRLETRLPDGRRLGYAWNRFGRVDAVTLDGHALTSHRWNEFAQEVERDQGGLTSRYAYDPAGRLERQAAFAKGGSAPLIERDYGRDAFGRIVSVSDVRSGTDRYVYDPAGQLLEAQQTALERFAHDPAGNLSGPEATRTQGNRLLMHGDRHFAYDADGNLVEERRGTGGRLRTVYEYDAAHRLVTARGPRSVGRYAYDALGRRILKVADGLETRFFWDGATLLGEESVHDASASVRWYVYEPGSHRPLACVQQGRRRPASVRLATLRGEPAEPGPIEVEVFHFHLDHAGVPREMTDASGRIVWSGRLRAWGSLSVADVDEVDNPLRMQGQYHDAETGLHYNFQRYYDPRTGRFITQDPLGLAGGLNAYAFAPNPVHWIDPLGLTCGEGEPEVFPNQLPERLPSEMATARRYGIEPSTPGTPEFDEAISQGTVKYAVTESGEVKVIPKYASDGTEISHPVITGGQPVTAAGEAEIAGSADEGYFGLDVNQHSGHYMNGDSAAQNEAVLDVAKGAFDQHGIGFP